MRKMILAITLIFHPMLFGSIPENPWDKADGPTWNISEAEFHERIDQVYAVYSPIFKELGVNFWFERQWTSHVVNLYADIWENQWNKNWKIIVHGGLARRPQLTKDGFVLALCHELGHLVAGFPLKNYTKYSSEGQSDFYATHVCAKKVFGEMAKKAPIINLGVKVPICDTGYDTKLEQDVCYLTVFAAKSLADTLSQITGEYRTPEIDIKDSYKAPYIIKQHSSSQCRLDTMIAGLLCQKPWDDKIIPYDKKNASCLNRPECWYKVVPGQDVKK